METGTSIDNKETSEISHPSHYTTGPIECIDAIASMLGPDKFRAFCLGQAMKYIWRCQYKGELKTDLEKARWYLDYTISDRAWKK